MSFNVRASVAPPVRGAAPGRVLPACRTRPKARCGSRPSVLTTRVPGVLRVRRFQSVDGGTPNFAAVWELKDPGVPSTPAFRAAVETPWTHWTRTHYTRVMRGIYRPR